MSRRDFAVAAMQGSDTLRYFLELGYCVNYAGMADRRTRPGAGVIARIINHWNVTRSCRSGWWQDDTGVIC